MLEQRMGIRQQKYSLILNTNNYIGCMKSSSILLTAKKSHYGVDGTGRDTYINFDNGGNYRGYRLEGLGKFELGTMRSPSINKKKSYTGIEGKPLHYIGDGTGRDVYVISDEGGIASRGITKKFNFLESLRAPIHRKQIKKDDILSRTNDSWRSKGSRDSTYKSLYQGERVQRLSQPKKYDDPYTSIRNSFRVSIGIKC